MLKRTIQDGAKRVLRAMIPPSLISIAKDSQLLPAERRISYVRRRLLHAVGASRQMSLPPNVSSVLFVCHGNIMRSAAAAGFLRDELRAASISGVRVTSAGTHAHDGRSADTRALDAALTLGLSLHAHKAARLTKKMISESDVVFAMDELNYVNIFTSFPDSRPKLLLFGGMTGSGVYRAHEIPDPYMKSPGEVNATIASIKGYVTLLAKALASSRASS